MKRLANSWALAAVLVGLLLCVCAPRAAAQNDGSIRGQILDVAGKPWAEIGVQAVSEQGVKQDTKTDKDGNYTFRNLRSGVYTVLIILPAPNKPYESQLRVQGDVESKVDVNFKDVVTKQGSQYAEQAKKQEEEKAKFEGMKQHFTAGNALLEQERKAKEDLLKTPPDQRDAAKQKLIELSNQSATEFEAAQKAASEKDPNQHLIWAKVAEAYDVAGRNDDAAHAYQQAITAKPDVPGYYNNLGNVLARSGKIDDARAAYTKSAELDPPNAATAWRNFGISLYNAGRLKEAVEPLKKATELDPKSAQSWYLLGAALVGSMEYKKVGDKMEVVVLPGTVEAYQKAIELDPNSGPNGYGAQAKLGLEALQQMAPGIETKVNVRKKKS
ncbi:MAG TPA: tetratricopeptide repeat protein [Candidatus Dormibacteraeota bacterium]|nr:tetratricopeptide repeat protein [Candidatus Dormibacteraeota bacterium]